MVINVDFNTYQVSSYNSEDRKSTATVSQDGTSLTITGNGWKSINIPSYTITPNTILSFQYKSTAQGEIQGISLEDDSIQTASRAFRLYGTQPWGRNDYNNYSTSAGEWKTYEIEVGKFYTGDASKILFINDQDITNPTAQSIFANVLLKEANETIPENNKPDALDDKGTTLINKALTFKISSLLANDTDADSDTLSLTRVRAVQGGTVTLDGKGNVIFTPNADYQGPASFTYTISDGKGGTDTATVSVNVKTASIGTNLGRFNETQQPFLDLFRDGGRWLTRKSGTWDTQEQNLLSLDENGWVKSLTGTGTSQQFTSIGVLLNNSTKGNYQGGKYVVLYDGEGTINYSLDAKKIASESRSGRDVIEITPSNSGFLLEITSTDPNKTGDYLRNIHVVPIENEFDYSTKIFNPKFLEKVDPFNTLRYMDWMNTNNSRVSDWDDRSEVGDAFWNNGVPVEVMVELANRTDANPWFTLPHMASDDYITNFAQYVKQNLEPGRTVYLEMSNEVWNPLFSARNYYEGLSPTLTWAESYGQRTKEMLDIWENAFGAEKDRIFGVLGGQYVNTSFIAEALAKADNIDAIGVNLYVGRYLGNTANRPTVLSWLEQGTDGALDKLFDNLLTGAGITPGAGSLPELAPYYVNEWRKISDQYNLPLVAYEGGQSLVVFQGYNQNQQPQAVSELFSQANRDPRMGQVYEKLLTQWYQLLGGDLFMQYNDISSFGAAGNWGLLENPFQDRADSPKYDSVLSFIENYSTPGV